MPIYDAMGLHSIYFICFAAHMNHISTNILPYAYLRKGNSVICERCCMVWRKYESGIRHTVTRQTHVI